jgi:hypothetical protein
MALLPFAHKQPSHTQEPSLPGPGCTWAPSPPPTLTAHAAGLRVQHHVGQPGVDGHHVGVGHAGGGGAGRGGAGQSSGRQSAELQKKQLRPDYGQGPPLLGCPCRLLGPPLTLRPYLDSTAISMASDTASPSLLRALSTLIAAGRRCHRPRYTWGGGRQIGGGSHGRQMGAFPGALTPPCQPSGEGAASKCPHMRAPTPLLGPPGRSRPRQWAPG